MRPRITAATMQFIAEQRRWNDDGAIRKTTVGNHGRRWCSGVTADRISALGFPPPTPVATLPSIAHLFGTTTKRCGIYLLEFPGDRYYIGQAKDVVRRFAQHRQRHPEIIGFAFLQTRVSLLDGRERDLIQRAESLGIVILNTVHVSQVIGDTDLDNVLSPDQQVAWLSAPAAFNHDDGSARIVLPTAHVERSMAKYREFQRQPLYQAASELLADYVTNCIPLPRQTEYSFWVASCLPSTNASTWPRLICVSAATMELFCVGHHKGNPREAWGFLVVALDKLPSTRKGAGALMKRHPDVEFVHSSYRDAGEQQLRLWTEDTKSLAALLRDETVRQAAAAFALRVMRKRPTIYSKFHCKQLADAAVARGAAVSAGA